jgi:plasmid stabilization system protein ParE
MHAKPLELHPEAEEDYLNALAWYRDQSLSAAMKLEDAFWRAIQTVEDAPERWPVYFSHFRRYTLHQFPFSVVYRIESSRTFVLAVAHGRRRPGYWKDRV